MLEILSPAGSPKSFLAAINNGADAVYLGLKKFSARASADNFNYDELYFYSSYAKLFGVKIYATINTLVKDSEIPELVDSVEDALKLGVDAFIVQDIFLGKKLKEIFPQIVLHLSTQAGVCNVYGAQMAKDYGFSRVVLARETLLEDIKSISSIIETECFIQGALCSSFSGHCYMSSFVGANSGNRGLCKQPCRKKCSYYINDKKVTDDYSLSLSDLSVNELINKYIEAGVTSFKIEGRMRRPEYVAAATKYYKNLIHNKDINISELKRTFNRNNYTKGLAFGQDKNFLSSKIQGHIGEYVGKILKIKGKKIVIDNYFASLGDSFKILRNGKEIGSATCKDNELYFSGNVKIGDEVYITTDVKLNERLLQTKINYPVFIQAILKAGEKGCFTVSSKNKSFTYFTEDILQPAKNNPVDTNMLYQCFSKVNQFPFDVKINLITDSVFIPKSILNEIRRTIYDKIFYFDKKDIEKIKNYKKINFISDINAIEKACISQSKTNIDNLNIIFPEDYSNFSLKPDDYLYIPSYANHLDLKILKDCASKVKGFYVDGYYGLYLAKELNKEIIVGTGLNVFNSIDLIELNSFGIDYKNIVLSKELSLTEMDKFPKECKRFILGNIALMDLIYCPFGKNCNSCPVNGKILLKDEENRVFKVKRYKLSSCRFIVYNAFDLIPKSIGDYGALFDFSMYSTKEIDYILENLDNLDVLKKNFKHTNGNLIRGIN